MEKPLLELPTGRQIRAFRSWLGLSQVAFARVAGIGAATVFEIESARRDPRKSTLLAITAVMVREGVKLDAGVLLVPP